MTNEILTCSPQLNTNEYLLARRVAEKLHATYPGHLWAVDIQGSIVNVRDLAIDGRWGFTLHIPAMYSSSEFDRQVVMAGGELLERFKQRRGAVDHDAIQSMPTDVRGLLTPEL